MSNSSRIAPALFSEDFRIMAYITLKNLNLQSFHQLLRFHDYCTYTFSNEFGGMKGKNGAVSPISNEDKFLHEIEAGPHAQNTGELKGFKIQKEESSSSGVRRIKASIG